MKHKKTTIFGVLLVGLMLVSTNALKAQDLLVNLNSGEIENYPISEISSLKFGTTSMILTKLDATQVTWEIDDIASYSFDESNALTIENSEKWDLSVFPNPAREKVTISFKSDMNENITIDIIDVSGKVITQLINGKHHSSTDVTWNVHEKTQVMPGTYICRIQTDNKLITRPIIIQ